MKNLRTLIDEGMNSGPPIENFNPEEFLEELKRKYNDIQQSEE